MTGPAGRHPLLGLGPVAHSRLAPSRSNTQAILYFVYRFKAAEWVIILLRSVINGPGSLRNGILLTDPGPHLGPPDPDPYPFQPNVKLNYTILPENFNIRYLFGITVLVLSKYINLCMTPMTLTRKIKQCRFSPL